MAINILSFAHIIESTVDRMAVLIVCNKVLVKVSLELIFKK